MFSEDQKLQRFNSDLSIDGASVLTQLVAGWPGPAWISTPDGQVLYGSTWLNSLVSDGTAASNKGGRASQCSPLDLLFQESDVARWRGSCLSQAIATESFSGWFRGLKEDGASSSEEHLIFQSHSQPLTDKEGTLRGWVTFCHEVAAHNFDESSITEGNSKSASGATGSFRELANTMPHLVWLAEGDGRVVYYNTQVTRFEGFQCLPDGTWQWDAVVHPDEREKTVAAWQKGIENRGIYECEHRVLMKDGTFRWHLSRAHLGDDGMWYGTATDVHELKVAQNRFREVYARFMMALEASQVIVFGHDVELRYTWIHNALEGFCAETMLGRKDTELLENLEEAHALESVKRSVLETGVPLRTEVSVTIFGDVRHFDLFVQAEINPAGETIGVICAAVDITDRKRVENDLHRSETRFRKTFEHAAMGVAHVGLNGEWLKVNQRYCEILGYSEAELLECRFMEVTHPDDAGRDWQQTRRLIAGEINRYAMEKRYIRKDGSIVPVILTVSLIHDARGEPDYFIAVAEDITVRKQSEDQLREQDKRKEEFLATLAHELRNPLAPIRTGLEVMKLATGNPELLEETRATMERQTRQLISIVDDLLDVSRISQGKLTLRKVVVDLDDIIRDAIDSCKPALHRTGHQVSIWRSSNGVRLEGDPHRLTQILSNLINNAIKYSPVPGTIRIAADVSGSEVMLSVSDDGIGIPKDMLEKIFEMFAQLPSSASSEDGYAGLGIGLTLVKSLTEMHGGRVNVKSNGTGQGSTFTITLPRIMSTNGQIVDETSVNEDSDLAGVRTRDRNDQRRAEGLHGSERKKLKVLVVDDNLPAAKTLGIVIRMLGNVVQLAHDGLEAVKVAEEFLPHLIFMDIGMPRMDGYQAAERIRESEWGREMVLVALTGWGQEEDRERAKSSGFDHHITKPAEPNEIKRLLSLVSGRSIL